MFFESWISSIFIWPDKNWNSVYIERSISCQQQSSQHRAKFCLWGGVGAHILPTTRRTLPRCLAPMPKISTPISAAFSILTIEPDANFFRWETPAVRFFGIPFGKKHILHKTLLGGSSFVFRTVMREGARAVSRNLPAATPAAAATC